MHRFILMIILIIIKNEIKMSEEKVIVANKGLVRADFAFWVGQYLDKFYDGLENKKIMGNKCPKCGDVFVPPRKICGKCNVVIPLEENWVDLPETGTLMNFTTTAYRVNDRSSRKAKDWTIGMIQIDGSNTSIVYRLLKMELEDVKIGMKVQIEWSEKTKGDPSDIKGFIKV
ncbi:MAG: Zn-ribbon domain-containing OB-fold protein [Promethearchaeota archaeon]